METIKHQYQKRSQKDYSLSFKLSVVREVENGSIGNRAAMRKYGIQGHGTITEWRRKYGIFDIDNLSQR
jgi:transposase-like protein